MTAPRRKRPPYIGGTTFEASGEVPSLANDDHVAICVSELAWLQMATVVLNKSDTELEKILRTTDSGTSEAFMKLTDALRGIERRHAAVGEICEGAITRLLVVFDRLLNGPRPPRWADRRKAAK